MFPWNTVGREESQIQYSNTVTLFLIKQATFNTANITTEFTHFVENSIRTVVAKGTVNNTAAYRCP